MSDKIYEEGKRLYILGFAILWLHEKSKRPVDTGWTTGPRKSWDELKKQYKKGMNIGVRLGTPSKIENGFLAAIDCDIKSKEKRHVHELNTQLKKLAGESSLPEVVSGRGNGSKHLYCRTHKSFAPFTPYHSEEWVKYKAPSKQPSKREREELGVDEIAAGYRLGRAWEISVYSDGRQCVLSPSVHPDTGNTYRWRNNLSDAGDLPFIKFKIPAEEKTKTFANHIPKTKEKFTFIPNEVDVSWLPVSDEIRDGIVTGAGVDDRSEFLLRAASALNSAGLNRDQILSVLTHSDNYISSCAYEHVQTKRRERAAYWLWKYTVRKILLERPGFIAFDDKPKAKARKLTKEEQAAQDAELAPFVAEDKGFHLYGPKGGLKPDHDSLLEHFEEENPFKTIADMKAVYVFNGTHYVDYTPIEVRAFSEVHFEPKPEEKTRTEFYAKVLANNVHRRSFFTDTTEGKINFKNGVLDLNVSDSKLLNHSPERGFRGVLPYDFDPRAEAEVFKEWLRGIMLGDQELMNVLQEFMGYIVRGGEYKYHKALWLGGVGRNGKSTFVDLLKALIGVGNFSVLSIKGLMNDKFAGADLDGKIANFSEETSPQELADSGPFKNLTGDGDIFAQKKYGDPYAFRNRAKLIMTYNTIPDLKDLSPGMLSRPLIVPFRKIIKEKEQDRSIKKKLFAELPGIFNFAMDGWRRLEEQEGFTHSKKSNEALQKIREESCNAYQWIENHVEFEKDFNINGVGKNSLELFYPLDLFNAYSKQEKFTFRPVEFYRRINAHPVMKRHRKVLNSGTVYAGIKLK